MPTIPDAEVAGEVDDRRVMALRRQDGGGYAELVAVDEELLVSLPAGASFEEPVPLTPWV